MYFSPDCITIIAGDIMDEYKSSYIILFNAISETLTMMDRHDIHKARERLIRAQQDAEESFINFDANGLRRENDSDANTEKC